MKLTKIGAGNLVIGGLDPEIGHTICPLSSGNYSPLLNRGNFYFGSFEPPNSKEYKMTDFETCIQSDLTESFEIFYYKLNSFRANSGGYLCSGGKYYCT